MDPEPQRVLVERRPARRPRRAAARSRRSARGTRRGPDRAAAPARHRRWPGRRRGRIRAGSPRPGLPPPGPVPLAPESGSPMSSRSTAAPSGVGMNALVEPEARPAVARDRAEMGAAAVEQRARRRVPSTRTPNGARRSSGRSWNVDSSTSSSRSAGAGSGIHVGASSPKRSETVTASPGSSIRPCRPAPRRAGTREVSRTSCSRSVSVSSSEWSSVASRGDRPQKEVPRIGERDRDVAPVLGEQTDRGEDVVQRRAAVPDARVLEVDRADDDVGGQRQRPLLDQGGGSAGSDRERRLGEQRDRQQAGGTRPQRRQGQCRLAPGQPEAERRSQPEPEHLLGRVRQRDLHDERGVRLAAREPGGHARDVHRARREVQHRDLEREAVPPGEGDAGRGARDRRRPARRVGRRRDRAGKARGLPGRGQRLREPGRREPLERSRLPQRAQLRDVAGERRVAGPAVEVERLGDRQRRLDDRGVGGGQRVHERVERLRQERRRGVRGQRAEAPEVRQQVDPREPRPAHGRRGAECDVAAVEAELDLQAPGDRRQRDVRHDPPAGCQVTAAVDGRLELDVQLAVAAGARHDERRAGGQRDRARLPGRADAGTRRAGAAPASAATPAVAAISFRSAPTRSPSRSVPSPSALDERSHAPGSRSTVASDPTLQPGPSRPSRPAEASADPSASSSGRASSAASPSCDGTTVIGAAPVPGVSVSFPAALSALSATPARSSRAVVDDRHGGQRPAWISPSSRSPAPRSSPPAVRNATRQGAAATSSSSGAPGTREPPRPARRAAAARAARRPSRARAGAWGRGRHGRRRAARPGPRRRSPRSRRGRARATPRASSALASCAPALSPALVAAPMAASRSPSAIGSASSTSGTVGAEIAAS